MHALCGVRAMVPRRFPTLIPAPPQVLFVPSANEEVGAGARVCAPADAVPAANAVTSDTGFFSSESRLTQFLEQGNVIVVAVERQEGVIEPAIPLCITARPPAAASYGL